MSFIDNKEERDAEYYAIISVYWKETTFDVVLTGTFPDILEVSDRKISSNIELVNLIRELNDSNVNMILLVNRSEYKTNWSNFIDSVCLINSDIPIKLINNQRNDNAYILLDRFLKTVGQNIMDYGDAIIAPLQK